MAFQGYIALLRLMKASCRYGSYSLHHGCNSGIGLADTKLFLSKGFNVVATARKPSAATELQGLVEGSHGQLLILVLDLFSSATFQPALDVALEKFGKIDILVNNAGYGQFGMLEALSVDDYRRQFEVNVFGPIGLTKTFLPHFLATGKKDLRPLVIYVSSGAAHFDLPFGSPYMASKAALNLFVESVSYELAVLDPPISTKLIVIHGGVQSTHFSDSSNAAPVTALLGSDPTGASKSAEMQMRYGAYAAKVFGRFGQAAKASMTVEEAAEKVVEAASDGKAKLRYFKDSKDGGQSIMARMEGMREDEDPDDADDRYMQKMRKFFA